MTVKKIIIALAVFCGVLFTAKATNIIDLNEQARTGVQKSKLKIPKNG